MFTIMNKKIFLLKFNIYFFIITLNLFNIFFSLCTSYAQSFDIKNIQISKEFREDFKKIDVINYGFNQAFRNLISEILTSNDQDKINKLPLPIVKTMIESFSIQEEKFIDNIYYVSLDVSFNKKNVYNFLEKNNIFPSLSKKEKVLFIPILIEENNNDLILFSENEFYNKWIREKNKNDQLEYVLPSEDLEDILLIKSKYQDLENFDFKQIIDKYSLDNFIISLIYRSQSKTSVLSKIFLSEKLILDNQEFSKNYTSEQIVKELKVKYEDFWKMKNQINTSIKLPLIISIDLNKKNKIDNFENIISNFDLVPNYYVSKIDNKKVYYTIIFNGTSTEFISLFSNFGQKLDTKKKIWDLK